MYTVYICIYIFILYMNAENYAYVYLFAHTYVYITLILKHWRVKIQIESYMYTYTHMYVHMCVCACVCAFVCMQVAINGETVKDIVAGVHAEYQQVCDGVCARTHTQVAVSLQILESSHALAHTSVTIISRTRMRHDTFINARNETDMNGHECACCQDISVKEYISERTYQCNTYQCRLRRCSRVTHMNESCHTYQ